MLEYYIFREEEDVYLSENFRFLNVIKVPEVNSITVENIQPEKYGKLIGLYHIWKNVSAPYIGFSLGAFAINPKEEEIFGLEQKKVDAILLKKAAARSTPQEEYRDCYYGYDFEIMLTVLRKYEVLYYNYALKEIIWKKEYRPFTAILKRSIFQKFCAWLFRILHYCDEQIVPKASKMQNRYLEHLAPYLFMIYFGYHEKKMQILQTSSVIKCIFKSQKTMEVENENNLWELVQEEIEKGEIERAENRVMKSRHKDVENLCRIFKLYHTQRRYYPETLLEKTKDLKKLCDLAEEKSGKGIAKNKKKVFIFRWNSINHFETVQAFQELGFVCESVQIPYEGRTYDENFLKTVNQYFDENHYDLAFSLNYFPMLAEACYVHGIPYVSWSYDSPTYIGDYRYLGYATNHVFMFDSLEAERYRELGFHNVHYMPLAVNVKRYDEIKCTREEEEKYRASVSFVGNLYDVGFAPMMNYLTDYHKGFLNALIDNQFGSYDNEMIHDLITNELVERISQPEFHEALYLDTGNRKASRELSPAGRLILQLNRIITNRERLLIISMLAKHWDFKLYSSGSNKVFQNVIECGVVDYYRDMPKVFKNSRINLNVTFHSIQRGIPLRCLDIMGCHGLLLTNYQRDFEEHFKDQENILIFHSPEEAFEKTKFYLEHESLRQKIANKGYETVKKHYNYSTILQKILKISELEYLLDK